MPFNSQITRVDAQALIPEDVTRDIIKNVPEQSAVLRLGRRLPNMARAQRRMPVLASMVTAYFVTGDTGMKQTTEVDWTNKYINAEELAVIVPIPENVLADADYDIWGEIRPSIMEAMGAAIDAAVIYGTNAPASWPQNLLAGALAAGNSVILGTNADLYDDILSEGGTLATVETDGFAVTGHVGALTMKSRLRGVRDSNGNPIFLQSMQNPGNYMLDGSPIEFPMNGAINAAASLLISGDWRQLVYSIRQDISYKFLDQAVITDNSSPPNIIYNLPQQDMVAMRVTFRLGWQLPNPINRVQSVEANRYPFGVLTPT